MAEEIGGVLQSNMEQLNKKRGDLLGQQRVLDAKIAQKEEKKAYLTSRQKELETRQNELNCKSIIQHQSFQS